MLFAYRNQGNHSLEYAEHPTLLSIFTMISCYMINQVIGPRMCSLVLIVCEDKTMKNIGKPRRCMQVCIKLISILRDKKVQLVCIKFIGILRD